MQRISHDRAHPLFNTAATRHIEQAAANALPPHTLMQRAGRATARLAMALAPHARVVWIACGPGNNGGDGLEAAMHLKRSGRQVIVTWLGLPGHAPPDALASWQRAQAAGVQWADGAPEPLTAADLCIDALLGIGVSSDTSDPARRSNERLLSCLRSLHNSPAPVLAIDLPSGLDADTGQFANGFAPTALFAHVQRQHPLPQRHTLSLLTLKPGQFTATGRDSAGQVWFDDLGIDPGTAPPCAWLSGPAPSQPRLHNSHKGTYGDVVVVGGEGLAARGAGMGGAALLAASAALHCGAGRVLVTLLDDGHHQLDMQQPELMFRRFDALELAKLTVVCGCGGGEAVKRVLPEVITRAARLVLDADALNAIASDARLQSLVKARAACDQPTVFTPHPLEAARLLGTDASHVQAHRLNAATQLAAQFHCVVVLKGSGTVIANRAKVPHINPTGNARLATAGTGDVLAGMVGAHLAAGTDAFCAATSAVYTHGLTADLWGDSSHRGSSTTLTASTLAQRLTS